MFTLEEVTRKVFREGPAKESLYSLEPKVSLLKRDLVNDLKFHILKKVNSPIFITGTLSKPIKPKGITSIRKIKYFTHDL